MANLSRQYCAYFGEATEVWKRHVIGEIIVAFDEYRDSVCQTLQDAGNSGPSVSTGCGQDANNQGEILGVVLENAQQQAEQRIVNALNETLNQQPVLHFPGASNIANQTAQVNPPGESEISQVDVNSGQNDADDDSLDVSIKSEMDSSSESECESDTDDEEMQVKEEPNEEEDIIGRSEEQTDNSNNNNSNDHRKINDSQNDISNEAANEQVSNGQAMKIDGEEANLEEDQNGPVIIVVQYASPPSSPLNTDQSIISSEFNSRFNDEIPININEDIASDDEVYHVDAEDDGDGVLEDGEHVDNIEIEENDRPESDNEGSMIDEENAGEFDHFEDQVNMSGVEDNDEEDEEEDEDYLMNDEDSTDDTTDGEQEQAAGPSTSTGRRSTRQVSKRQSVPAGKSSKGPIKVKKTKSFSIVTKKLKCTVPGCMKVVKSKSALNDHLLTAHKLKPYRCLVRRCFGKVSTSFTTQSQLNDHRYHVHGRTSRWTCHCSKKFKSYHKLNTHYWQFHELGQFTCSKDGCTFKPRSTRIKVLNHLPIHGESNYECPVEGCGRSFKKKSHLDLHTLTHTGEHPFVCAECDKSFTEKGTLTTHLRIHRNNKCYRCTWPQCAYSGIDRGNALRHIRMVHFNLPATKKQQAEENIIDDRDARDYLAKD